MIAQLVVKSLFCCVVVLFLNPATHGDEPALTRPEMKQRLEALKSRTSRLPLPPPSDAEKASGRSLVNNGRLRALYLPPSWTSFVIPGWGGSGAARGAKSGTTATSTLNSLQSRPDYGFKTRVFWVVSRANDCQYCLGHQELKLKRAGMTEDQVAALDSDWSQFDRAEQVAMRIARKLTLEPQHSGSNEVQDLLHHYSPAETRDLLYTIARYNAVNRWTTATGIPQDQVFGGEASGPLDSPTSEKYASVQSTVAPTDLTPRAPWESQEVFEQRLTEARSRTPLVAIPSKESASQVLSREVPGVIPPQWFCALSDQSIALEAWAQRQAMMRDGKTPLDLRVLIAWVTARENRAWYAAAHARARLSAEVALYDFDQLQQSVPEGWRTALQLARKLTTSPQSITDADISGLREHFSDHETAEIIQLIADANAFDRFTESLQLTLEF